MKTILILIITILINLQGVSAQDDDLSSALVKITEVSLSGNAEDLLVLTSPRIIKAMGGAENALQLFKEAFCSLASQGLGIDTVINYNRLGVFALDDIEYSFIPQLIIMSIPDKEKKMISVTTLLALKESSTDRWTFIDYNNLTDENLNFLLPEFKDKVEFPRGLADKPLVIPNGEVEHSLNIFTKILDQAIEKRKSAIN